MIPYTQRTKLPDLMKPRKSKLIINMTFALNLILNSFLLNKKRIGKSVSKIISSSIQKETDLFVDLNLEIYN